MSKPRIKVVLVRDTQARNSLVAVFLQLGRQQVVVLWGDDLRRDTQAIYLALLEERGVSDGYAVDEVERFGGKAKTGPSAKAIANSADLCVLCAQGTSAGEDLGLADLLAICCKEAWNVDEFPSWVSEGLVNILFRENLPTKTGALSVLVRVKAELFGSD